MSSSNSKRRKVTVDIKQTKLERGSVFERLGNQEKRKKFKDSSEGKVKSKKATLKEESPSPECKKKSKSSSKLDDGAAKKSFKESTSGSSKSKYSHDNTKEQRKSHKHSDNADIERSGSDRTHSKHKVERAEGKLHHKVVENLIIEKRVSPSSSHDRSRSASRDSISPRKKSKKRATKHSSDDRSLERYDRQQSLSPGPSSSSQRQKERGRSREKKKSTKDASRKNKNDDFVEEYHESKTSSKSSTKVKKVSKQDKYEKEYRYEDDSYSEKKHKSKHSKENVVGKERSRKDSPVLYEESSGDHYRKGDVRSEDRGKAKRRKYEPESPVESPVRHKKSKGQPSFERETKESAKERSSKATLSPTKSQSKKRHRDDEVVSKKRVQKEDSLTYSDYSSASKHSQPEYSEISQTSGANDDPYSSDSYTEKEMKKRSKMKKKVKKEHEKSPTKVRYEVIDDDFSDDVKKTKKRKRKREERESPVSESPVKEERHYHEKERHRDEKIMITKKVERDRSPRGDVRRSDKYSQDNRDVYDRRSAQLERHDSSTHMSLNRGEKLDLRSPPNEKYYDSRKDDRERRKDSYIDMKHSSRDDRYTPDHRDSNYSKHKLDTRHLSAERSSESKVAEWQRKSSKHISTERKDSIPRLMQNTHLPEQRYTHQRKLLEPDYIFQQQQPQELMRPGRSFDRSGRGNERMSVRPPPLLPPQTYSRGHVTPPHVPRGRGMMENERRLDRGQNERRDSNQRLDSGDRKYNISLDSSGDRRVRSSSRDSRSSLRHASQDGIGKPRLQSDRGGGGLQSPRSDRNSSLERRKKTSSDRSVGSSGKGDKNAQYDRHSQRSIERTITDGKSDSRASNRSDSDRSRSTKRKTTDEQRQQHSEAGSSIHERKKAKTTLKHASPSPKRKSSKDARSTSSKRASESRKETSRTSKKSKERKKTSDISDTEINKLIGDKEEKVPEVDWNELPTIEKNEEEIAKEPSSVLSKFTPENILKKTGIILDMLPPHLAEKVAKMKSENEQKETESTSKKLVDGILHEGLNSYSDERLRKHLLGYNSDYRHPLRPPFIINAKTYSVSLKEYLRKSRMVEAI